MRLDDLVGDLIAPSNAIGQEGPRLGFFPCLFARTDGVDGRGLLDNFLHDGSEVGFKLEFVLLERLEDFIEVLGAQELADGALV